LAAGALNTVRKQTALRDAIMLLVSIVASIWLAFYLSGLSAERIGLESLLASFKLPDIRQRIPNAEQLAEAIVAPVDHDSATDSSRTHEIPISCGVPATAPLQRKAAHPVYRWTDEAGRVHLGDRKPVGQAAERVDLGLPREFDYFSLDISMVGFRSPPLVRADIEVGMTKIFHVLSEFLALEQLRKVTARIQLHAQSSTFNALYARTEPNAAGSVQGFYNSRTNMAVVLYDEVESRTMNTAIHEATHIINAGLLGRTPRWFNEGLAEYFERIEVRGSAGIVPVAPEWLRELSRSSARLRLPRLLGATQDDWHGQGRHAHYANSWALMHFLLEPQHRPLAEKLLRELARDRCDEIDSIAFFEQHYPGGVNRLEGELHAWLSAGRHIPHTY